MFLKLIRRISIFITCVVVFLLVALSCTPLINLIPYTYKDGSLIYVRPIEDYSTVMKGDSITYKLDFDGGVATNDVFAVDVAKGYYYIRTSEYAINNGMQNLTSAIVVGGVSVVPIDFSMVIGENVASFPVMGRVAEFLGTTSGLLIFAGIGIVFAFLAGIIPVKKKKDVKSNSKRKNESIAFETVDDMPDIIRPELARNTDDAIYGSEDDD